jgi:hypothetical protein
MLATVAAALLVSATPDPNLYKVKASVASSEVKLGSGTKLEIHFDLAQGAHISDEAPLTIKLSGDGVAFEKQTLHYGDSLMPRGPGPKFEDLVTVNAPGQHTVDLQMSFYVCTAELCNRASAHETVTVAAK